MRMSGLATSRANPVPSPTKELLPAEGEAPAVKERDLEEIMNMRDLIPVSRCVRAGGRGREERGCEGATVQKRITARLC